MIVAAIVALGAIGLMLIVLAIANPRIDDEFKPSTRDQIEPPKVKVTIRRGGAMPALRGPVTERRREVRWTQKPPRAALWELWEKRRRLLATADAKFVAGIAAFSVAAGLLVAHLA